MQNRPQTPRGGSPQGERPVRASAQSSNAPQPAQRSPQRTAQTGAARRPTGVPTVGRPHQAERPGGSTGASLNRAPSLILPLGVLVAALVVGILLQFTLLPEGWVFAEKARATEAVAEISSTRGVRLNEIMTANKRAFADENGACPDWVELYNASSAPVDITGWVLTDRASRTIRFAFPAYVMQPGEYAIVFADGFLHNGERDTWHAPFRLSSAGDTLMLFDENGTIVESVNVPELAEDCVYARGADGAWSVTGEYTPLMENTTYNYAQLTTTQVMQGSDLILAEIMASNASYPAPSGGLYDWIELYNRGSSPISLKGYGLSDKSSKPARWRLPDITLQPGQRLVVYASGLDRVMENGELHTDFRLAAEGETVLLYTPSRQVIDAVTYDNLKTDRSYKRQGDVWEVSASPTPGGAN